MVDKVCVLAFRWEDAQCARSIIIEASSPLRIAQIRVGINSRILDIVIIIRIDFKLMLYGYKKHNSLILVSKNDEPRV